MLRRVLLAASASDRIRQIITTAPYTRDVVARFVAGDTTDDVLATAGRLLAEGMLATVDYLGEDTTDPEQAAAVADTYVRLLDALGEAGLATGGRAELSVKPTAIGLGLPEHGEKTAAGHLARICAAAAAAGTTVTLDMEDHTRVEATLRILAELRAGVPPAWAACSSPTCGAPRRTARRWPCPGPGSACARAPTRPRTRWPSAPGPRWTGPTRAACGC